MWVEIHILYWLVDGLIEAGFPVHFAKKNVLRPDSTINLEVYFWFSASCCGPTPFPSFNPHNK